MKTSTMYLFILIFLCDEYQVISGNEKEADSKLFVHISIKKKVRNYNIDRKVVKGGNVAVKFETDFHVEEAGLLETNNKLPRWAPNKKKIPNLEIEKTHTKIILDFKGPVTEKHTEFKLIVLSEQRYCQENKKSPACNYEYNGKLYSQRTYTVTFRVTDYLKVTANGNEMKAYSISGDIPSNMVFLYELKYRPGDYNIAFNYLEKDDVTAKWGNGKQPASIQDSSKTVKLNKSLLKEDDGKSFNCLFTHEDKLNLSAHIIYKYVPVTDVLNVQVNGEILKSSSLISREDYGDTYRVFYNNDDKFDIDCIPTKDVCRKDRCKAALCIPYISSAAKSDACKLSSKTVSKSVTLKKEDDGALVNCSYTSEVFRGIETTVTINFELIQKISMEIDGKPYSEDETFEIKDNMRNVSIQCSSSQTRSQGYTPPLELILYQNRFDVIDSKDLVLSGNKMKITFEHSATLHDGDTIACRLKEKVTNKLQKPIEFGSVTINVKKKEIPTTTPSSTTLPDSAPDSPGGDLNTDNPEQSIASSGQNSGILSEPWFIYIIIACAVIVIIAIIVCIVKVSRRKPRDAEHLVPAEYETLNDTPPPPNFPQNARLEETYCKPADSKSSEPTYAQPYVPKSPEELYSKPVPKNSRKKPANNDTYASLAFKNAYAKIKPKSERSRQIEEPGYAEVGKYDEPAYASVQQYANLNKSAEATNREEYYNVFNNSSYANSKQKGEYVEPSYCEVSKLKK